MVLRQIGMPVWPLIGWHAHHTVSSLQPLPPTRTFPVNTISSGEQAPQPVLPSSVEPTSTSDPTSHQGSPPHHHPAPPRRLFR